MNIEWNPSDPAVWVRLAGDGLLRYVIYIQTPTGWAFSGTSYMIHTETPHDTIPAPVVTLLHTKKRLGESEPTVYYRERSGEILMEGEG